MKQKLIVLSADALVHEDMAHFKTLPNFKKYLAGGACVEKVRSIYPTITYCCHATMASGVYPEKHGLAGNLQFIPGASPLPWHWFYDSLKFKESIFKSAKQAGLTTAAIYWPTTGNNPYIDYLIDEYWTQSPDDTIPDCYARSGSSPEIVDIIRSHMDGITLRKHPECDDFIIACTVDIIRKFDPDVIFIHPANIDDARHHTGVFSPAVTAAVEKTDEWIGKLMAAEEENGNSDITNFVLTSDHGQQNITRALNMNVFFADKGYIRTNPDGSLKDWDVYSLSGGMSALIYLRDKENKKLYNEVYEMLKAMAEEGLYGFTSVFTKAEFNALHLDGDFSFVLESDGYTSFGDKWTRPLVIDRNNSDDYRLGAATHGYLPENGPQPVFYAKGPGFKENVTLENGRLIDEAPTYAKLLGVEIPGTQGIAMEQLLK